MPHSGYTICTSEQRLTSTAVSHGFVIERYSSPPFGSHGPCIHSKPCPLDFGIGVPCCNHSLASGGPGAILHNIRREKPGSFLGDTDHSVCPKRVGGPSVPTCPFVTGGRAFAPSVTQVLAQSLCSALESKHHLGLLPSPCTAVFDLLTCKLHRLLGPCFKTGREWHCCAKLHCLQHHTPTGGPAARLGHHQSGAATTRPPTPPWRAWALACP